ncbi:MAG: cyclase family protein, partial [Bacteroidota bacterium]
MIAQLKIVGQAYTADLTQPLDISIRLGFTGDNPNCFYAPLAEVAPVVAGDFVGDTQRGGLVNFKTIKVNPHGNGTHTECVGHIATELFFLPDCLAQYHHAAHLVSVYPQRLDNGDRVITR